jgi:DNA polymerase I-like protein with 3'-5' exonuclease and polymerase domains|nr:MAG TPA: DNA polymerase [Caudoviricetes sp.]
MGRIGDMFCNVSARKTQEAQKKALEMLSKKSSKKQVAKVVPKSISGKVQLAKEMSKEVFADKLDRLELLDNENKIREYIDCAITNGIIAVDTETNGLDRIDGKIAGVCLYTPGQKGVYIPVRHESFMTGIELNTNISKEFMKDQFERMNKSNIKYVLHNAKFDMHILWWMLGIKIIPYWDTQIGSQLLNENEPHKLKVLYKKYVDNADENSKVASFNSLFKGIEFNKVPPDVAYMYASFDPIMTYELYQFQYDFIDINGKYCKEKGLERVAEVFRNIEMPLIQVVFEMECTGVKIDTDLADKLKAQYTKHKDAAEEKFNLEIEKLNDKFDKLMIKNPAAYNKLFKDGIRKVSISSPTQLAILFYDVLEFESPDKKSPRGTGEAILKSFNHPLVDSILEYRSMSKLLSTYIEAIPQHIAKRDNRLHANFNQYGAKTGRFSSSDPNLQNIPSQKTTLSDGTVIDAGHDIRQMFIAGEGQVIVGGDFSQQEPRCLAHMSDDPHMLQAYLEGKDLYATIASKIYKMPYDECEEFRADGTVNPDGKARRTSVKPVLLGLMYGRGVPSIAEQMKISTQEAQKIIDDFYAEFPKVKEFVDFAQTFARDYGFVETAWGRKRRLSDMQLPPIEIKPCIKSYSDNFDPFAFDATESIPQDDYVPDEVYRKYYTLLNRARGRQQQQKVKELAEQEGYTIKDNRGFIEDAKRQCVNSIIQGSAADMTKLTMIKIFNDEELNKLGYKLIIPVHDEVLGICPRENAKAVRDRLEYIMVHIVDGKFKIPMKCDIEVTERWYGEGIEI